MKIIALPDLHDNIDHLADIASQLKAVDLVLLVGDLTNVGKEEQTARVVEAIRHYNPNMLAVPGNWDRPQAGAYLSQLSINLHRSHRVINGFAFIGVGAALYAPVRTPNEIGEDDFRIFLEEAASGLDDTLPKVLICHQPPFQTLVDKTWSGLHIGSESIRAFIETVQPLLCFTGHVHGGVGIDTIGSTQIINPGPLWEGRYAYADLEDQQIKALEIRER